MNENNNTNKRTAGLSFLPQGIVARVGLVVALALSFWFGSLITGGGDSGHDHSTGASSAVEEPSVWTCSMHPQIQLPEAGKCPICFMDLIPLENGDDDDLEPRQLRMSEAAKKNARIVTAEVKRGFAEREVRLVGKLAVDETKLAYITAWVPGRLEKLYADYTGVTVEKGDKLVSIYSPALISAQEELLQAKEAVSALSQSSPALLGTAEKTLSAAREKLRLVGLSESQVSEIEKTGAVSERLTIYAPIGGVVLHKNAVEGVYVKTGEKIYTLADLNTLWVTFDAYESDLAWLREGQPVTFTTKAYPGETFSAVIDFIDPTLNPRTRTATVRALFENSESAKSHSLKPDMFVSGVVYSRIDGDGLVVEEVGSGVTGDALLIPATAPLLTGERAIVFVELPESETPIFEGRVVTLGPRAGDFFVVKSGIEEGDMVVVNGAFKLDAELQIRAKPSMMSPPELSDTADALKIEQAEEIEPLAVSTEARDALTPLYKAYFPVQEALADDDFAKTQTAYQTLSESLRSVDMSLFTGGAHMKWMTLSARIDDATAQGASTTDIASARLAFFDLSKAMIELNESFGHAGTQDYFLTYCPMAMDNTGAFWLQTGDIVDNSFYGESMLRCGSIEETLQAVQ